MNPAGAHTPAFRYQPSAPPCNNPRSAPAGTDPPSFPVTPLKTAQPNPHRRHPTPNNTDKKPGKASSPARRGRQGPDTQGNSLQHDPQRDHARPQVTAQAENHTRPAPAGIFRMCAETCIGGGGPKPSSSLQCRRLGNGTHFADGGEHSNFNKIYISSVRFSGVGALGGNGKAPQPL